MAIATNTFTRYDAKGLREQLADVIYNISPTETPLVSMMGKESAKQTLFEWQTQSLAAVNTGNAVIEGDDAPTYAAGNATVRVGNYTQISRKLIIVSGTLDAVDKAGRRSELAHQIALRGKELKRDIEAICFENLGANAGDTGTARQTATLGAWVKSNTDTGTSGGDPVYTSGVPGAARTDGTQRAFTETILKAVISSCYTSGANVDGMHLFVGPFNKQAVSAFSGVVTRNFDMSNREPKPTAVIAAVDVYVSDFGVLRVVPSRFQRERDAWLIDPDMLSLATLRPFQTIEMAKTGDAEKRMMLVEWGLKVKQEAGLGLAADLTAS